MNPFEEYVYERFAEHMRSWSPELGQDIYIMVIFICFVDDDVRAPQLLLMYNTISSWKDKTAVGAPEAWARWNTAYWLHNLEFTICQQPYMTDDSISLENVDWRGVGLRDAYMTFKWPRTESEALKAMIDVCAAVTCELHTTGVVADVCGRPVPIVFDFGNDMSEDEYRFMRIRDVNPPGLTYYYEHWREYELWASQT